MSFLNPGGGHIDPYKHPESLRRVLEVGNWIKSHTFRDGQREKRNYRRSAPEPPDDKHQVGKWADAVVAPFSVGINRSESLTMRTVSGVPHFRVGGSQESLNNAMENASYNKHGTDKKTVEQMVLEKYNAIGESRHSRFKEINVGKNKPAAQPNCGSGRRSKVSDLLCQEVVVDKNYGEGNARGIRIGEEDENPLNRRIGVANSRNFPRLNGKKDSQLKAKFVRHATKLLSPNRNLPHHEARNRLSGKNITTATGLRRPHRRRQKYPYLAPGQRRQFNGELGFEVGFFKL